MRSLLLVPILVTMAPFATPEDWRNHDKGKAWNERDHRRDIPDDSSFLLPGNGAAGVPKEGGNGRVTEGRGQGTGF